MLCTAYTSFARPHNCFFPPFLCYRVHEFEVRINERQKHVYLFNIKSKIAILFVQSRNYREEKRARRAEVPEMKNNWNEFIERFLPFILFLLLIFRVAGVRGTFFLGADSCLITRRAFYLFLFFRFCSNGFSFGPLQYFYLCIVCFTLPKIELISCLK